MNFRTVHSMFVAIAVLTAGAPAGSVRAQEDPFATRPPVTTSTLQRDRPEDDPLSTTLNPDRQPFVFPTQNGPETLLNALADAPDFPWDFMFGSTPLDQFVSDRKQEAENLVNFGMQRLSASPGSPRQGAPATIGDLRRVPDLTARQLYVLGIMARKLDRRKDALKFFETGIKTTDDPGNVAAMRNALAAMYGSMVDIGNVPFLQSDTSSASDAIRIHRLAISDISEQNRAHRQLHFLRLIRLHQELNQMDDAVRVAIALAKQKPEITLEDIFGVPTFAINAGPNTPTGKFLKRLLPELDAGCALRAEAQSLLDR